MVVEKTHVKLSYIPGVTPGKWKKRWDERIPANPIVNTQLSITMVSEKNQLESLCDGTADFALVRLPIKREGLHIIPLYNELAVAVVDKEHPVTVFEEITLEMISDETIIENKDDETSLDWVEAGLGIAIMPMSVARYHNRKKLQYRPVVDAEETSIALAWPNLDGSQHGYPESKISEELKEELIGVLRGRTAQSSRQPSVIAKQKQNAEKSQQKPRTVHNKSHAARRRRKK